MALIVSLAAVLFVVVVTTPREKPLQVTRVSTVTRPGLYRGVSAKGWAYRYRVRGRELRRTRRILFSRPSIREAIDLAGATYGFQATLWRKARCETGGTFSPRSFNRRSQASGLFQFLPSTWNSTPYARFSIWSPYANALAAGWMHAHGRGGEWACH